MATENIMMDAVKRGGDRQELHELIRQHSMAAGYAVKMEGKENDLLDRIAADEHFGVTRQELEAVMDPKNYIGCAALQTADYLENVVRPTLAKYADVDAAENEIKV